MLVSSVSSIRFKGSAEDFLSRPGAFAKSPESAPDYFAKPEKKSKAVKYLIGALVFAVGILAGAAAAEHFAGKNIFKVLPKEELAKADILQKTEHYIATLGKWVIKQGEDFAKWAGTLFKSKPQNA